MEMIIHMAYRKKINAVILGIGLLISLAGIPFSAFGLAETTNVFFTSCEVSDTTALPQCTGGLVCEPFEGTSRCLLVIGASCGTDKPVCQSGSRCVVKETGADLDESGGTTAESGDNECRVGSSAGPGPGGGLPGGNFRLPNETEIPISGTALLEKVGVIGNWVFAIFLAISLIYIILAAFEFVTGAGEPTKVSGARQKLIYAAVGIGVALLAAGIDDIVRSIVTT
ncbi:MAG: hypothetical protein HY482_02365 [Candidatus Wildermuthbacteria bacterium]|nr:hypothetical protein [Candidatus Wildermuthbacteria bacterium]